MLWNSALGEIDLDDEVVSGPPNLEDGISYVDVVTEIGPLLVLDDVAASPSSAFDASDILTG